MSANDLSSSKWIPVTVSSNSGSIPSSWSHSQVIDPATTLTSNSGSNAIESSQNTWSTTNYIPATIGSTSVKNEDSFVQPGPSSGWSVSAIEPEENLNNGESIFNVVINAAGEPVSIENTEVNVEGDDISEWRSTVDSMITDVTNSFSGGFNLVGSTNTDSASMTSHGGNSGHIVQFHGDSLSLVGMPAGSTTGTDEAEQTSNMNDSTNLHG